MLAQWNMGWREKKSLCHWMKLCPTTRNPLSNLTKNWGFVLPVFVQEAESFWPFKLSLSMVWIAGWVFGMSAPAVNATYQVFDRHLCCLIFVYILFWIWYCTRDSTLHFFSVFLWLIDKFDVFRGENNLSSVRCIKSKKHTLIDNNSTQRKKQKLQDTNFLFGVRT